MTKRDRPVVLELRRKSLLSGDCIVEEDRRVVAELRCSRWRSQATLSVDGRSLELRRSGVLRRRYSLTLAAAPLVEVIRPSAWSSRLTFAFDGVEYEARNEAWFSSTLLVESRGRTIGRIRRKGAFCSGAIVELPDRLPVAVRTFLGWVAMVRWSEAAAVAASGGAG